MMLILLSTSGCLLRVTNGLNLLNKKIIFSVLFIFCPLTVYMRRLREIPAENRKPK